MRGRPVFQWLMFVIAWSGFLVPIFHVTRATPAAEKVASPAISGFSHEASWLGVRFSYPPDMYSFSSDEQIIWSEEQPSGLFFEQAVQLRPQEYGLEITLAARFNITSAVAAEVTLESPGGQQWSRTVWLESPAEEVLHFDWIRHE